MADKVMVITGALGALGQVVARRAASAGWRVAVIDHAATAPEGFEATLGEGHLVVGGVDLTDEAEAGAAFGRVVAHQGRLDALLNVAGGFAWETAADGSPATWERMFRLNLVTALNSCRAALPHLAAGGRGRIVNVGAGGALKAARGMGAYAASKAGVHRLTEALAEEWKGRVTVNAVLPSIIDTPQNRADMPDADFTAWVTTDELAAAMLFLASPEASGITGALLPIGGRV